MMLVPTSAQAPAAPRTRAGGRPRGRAAEHHPAPIGAFESRHDQHLSAGHRPRGDHHGGACAPRPDDVRQRRAAALNERLTASTSGSAPALPLRPDGSRRVHRGLRCFWGSSNSRARSAITAGTPPAEEAGAAPAFGDLRDQLRGAGAGLLWRHNALLDALERHLPEAQPSGIEAGLHLTVQLSADIDPAALVAAAARRQVGITTIDRFTSGPASGESSLVLGCANLPRTGRPPCCPAARGRGHRGTTPRLKRKASTSLRGAPIRFAAADR